MSLSCNRRRFAGCGSCGVGSRELGLESYSQDKIWDGEHDMARGTKRGVAKRGKAKKAKTAVKKIAKQAKPIELYYWPTPNGFKISIMLEECGLPYVLKPVNISKGEQFKPDFLKIAPNNRMPAIVDPQGPGGRPISIFESGAILQYLSVGRTCARRSRSMAVLANGRTWSDGRPAQPLQALCA
jgi:hypothetical protein